jgi:MFS transporter, ACS family, hexuronate transporter
LPDARPTVSATDRSCVTTGVPSVPAGKVSRRRWFALALVFLIIVVNFIDRQTLSMLAPVLRMVFHLSNAAYGRIVAALQFGMMSGEFPMGWLMDRWGARIGLTAAVLGWSAVCGSQYFTRSGLQLGITRFGMGATEVASYSGGMKTVSRLFADREKTLAIGIFNSGSVIGTAIAPPLVVFLLHRFGFRVAFLAPAVLASLWLPAWWFVQRGSHADSAAPAAARVPLRVLLRQSSGWAVMVCRMLVGPVIQFYWYWLPSYLYTARHLSLAQIGLVAWIPFVLGVVGGVSGGWTAGWLMRRGVGLYNTRRITMIGSALACAFSFAVPWSRNAATALALISLVVMAHNFLSANMYAAITDLFPSDFVGRVTGLTGVSGGLSGFLLPLFTGILVDRYSYTPVFMLIAFMPLAGAVALFVLGRGYRHHDSAEIEST